MRDRCTVIQRELLPSGKDRAVLKAVCLLRNLSPALSEFNTVHAMPSVLVIPHCATEFILEVIVSILQSLYMNTYLFWSNHISLHNLYSGFQMHP